MMFVHIRLLLSILAAASLLLPSISIGIGGSSSSYGKGEAVCIVEAPDEDIAEAHAPARRDFSTNTSLSNAVGVLSWPDPDALGIADDDDDHVVVEPKGNQSVQSIMISQPTYNVNFHQAVDDGKGRHYDSLYDDVRPTDALRSTYSISKDSKFAFIITVLVFFLSTLAFFYHHYCAKHHQKVVGGSLARSNRRINSLFLYYFTRGTLLHQNVGDNTSLHRGESLLTRKDNLGIHNSNTERLVRWNAAILEHYLRKLVHYRHSNSSGTSDVMFTPSEEDKVLLFSEKLSEQVMFPATTYPEALRRLSGNVIEISPTARTELLDYVGRIALMYRDVPFHNCEFRG
eukprot:scaffold13320_cov215-Alexandrium_tamarense.AAC.25